MHLQHLQLYSSSSRLQITMLPGQKKSSFINEFFSSLMVQAYSKLTMPGLLGLDFEKLVHGA